MIHHNYCISRLFSLFVLVCIFVIAEESLALAPTSSSTTRPYQPVNNKMRRQLPEKLLIGYGINVDKVRKSVHDGVNVVIWAFMDIVAATAADSASSSTHRELQESASSRPHARIRTGLDLEGIRQLIQELDQDGEHSHVVHLVSFGGWNGPHLDPHLSAEEWFACFKENVGDIFHGVDWDLEGNDDLDSPYNVFTVECLDKMGHISKLMKDGMYHSFYGYLFVLSNIQSMFCLTNNNLSCRRTVFRFRWVSRGYGASTILHGF